MIILLQRILKKIAQRIIKKYKPEIIAITGSVGKTSAKEAIFAVLANRSHLTLIDKRRLRVRSSKGNLNNELGMPLTIIGNWKEEELKIVSRAQPAGTRKLCKLFFWIRAILRGFFQIIFNRKYPQIIILEFGADRPGDIDYLLDIARPKIGVITAIGKTPAHAEFYSGAEETAKEKSKILVDLPDGGFAVLNRDDEQVMKMGARTKASIITYGFGEEADVKISNFENRSIFVSETGNFKPEGISFKIEYQGSFVPVNLNNIFGRAQAYSVAAAFSVGLIYGLNLVEMSELIERFYVPARRRMNLIEGKNESWIIDDSYNASPLSVEEALNTLKDLQAKRKIAILGDMLELGKKSDEAHREMGELVFDISDVLITVGPNAKLIAEEAKDRGMKNVKMFDSAKELLQMIQEILKPGDLVLVKASRAMRLDKIVEGIRKY